MKNTSNFVSIVLLSFFFCLNLQSQNTLEEIVVLENKISATSPTEKINLLFKISKFYQENNLDKAIFYRKKLDSLVEFDATKKVQLVLLTVDEHILKNELNLALNLLSKLKKDTIVFSNEKYFLKISYLESLCNSLLQNLSSPEIWLQVKIELS